MSSEWLTTSPVDNRLCFTKNKRAPSGVKTMNGTQGWGSENDGGPLRIQVFASRESLVIN
jgi:hypothetical protein